MRHQVTSDQSGTGPRAQDEAPAPGGPGRSEPPRRRGWWDALGRRAVRAARGAIVGAAPGVALVLVAQFAVDGEMQLTVGAPGILLAAVGAVLGLAHGLSPRRSW